MPGYQPRVTTDPVWFNGTNINDWDPATGLGVRVTEMRGWDERPDVRDVRELRSGQDGESADNLFLGGRTITLVGTVYGSSWVNLQARKRALAALLQPSSTEVLLKVPDPATASPTAVYATTGMTGYERVSCRVVDPILFGDLVGSVGMTWQVSVRASDPRVYSDVETSTDSGTTGTAARTVTVDQGGTYNTPVTINVTGATGSSWGVTDSDSATSLQFASMTLGSGDVSKISTLDRTITWRGDYAGVRLIRAATSLQGLWMLNETSGTTADNAQGTAARDGTYTGGYTLNQTGPDGTLKSVDLNGTTGYVSIPNQSALYGSYSLLECWVNFDTLTGTQTIIDSLSSNKGFRVVWDGSKIVLSVGLGASTVTSTGSPWTLSTGTWYRIVAFTAEGSSEVYAQNTSGVTLFGRSVVTTVPSAQTAGGHRIGATIAGADFLNGKVSAFGLYTTTTSADMFSLATGVLDGNIVPVLSASEASAYQYLEASSSQWANLGTGSRTYTLASSGLATGSKLNVTYRDARI